MILPHHPDNYNIHGRQALGYWRSEMQPTLPNPADYVDTEWNRHDRAMVIEYLRSAASVVGWRGYSTCRFCGKWNNGTDCLGDAKFVWPEGFAHYVEAHSVRPPNEFVEHVREQGSRWLPPVPRV